MMPMGGKIILRRNGLFVALHSDAMSARVSIGARVSIVSDAASMFASGTASQAKSALVSIGAHTPTAIASTFAVATASVLAP